MPKNRWSRPKSNGEMLPYWWLRWVPTVVISVIILYLLYVVGRLAIIPILASVALAYLLNPLVRLGEKRGLSRSVSAIIAICAVSVIIGLFMAYVIPDMWEEGTKATTKIVDNFTPENAARQRTWLRRYSPGLERVAGDAIENFLSDPIGFYNEHISPPKTTVSEEGEIKVEKNGGGSFIFSMLNSSVDLLLVPFFVFYILIDFQRWRDSFEGLIPPRFRDAFSRLFDEAGRILESYVRAQLLIGFMMAILYAVGFWFFNVPAWAGIALIAGLLNAVPYVGSIIGIILACSFTIAEGGGVWNIVAVLGVFVAVQTFEGYVLTPRILGGRLNLHPMAVFLGLLIGGKLFGLLGFVLAIPAIAIGKVFLRFLRELYEDSYFYHGGEYDSTKAPKEKIEERIAEAAENVLAEQENIEKMEKAEKDSDMPVFEEENIKTDYKD